MGGYLRCAATAWLRWAAQMGPTVLSFPRQEAMAQAPLTLSLATTALGRWKSSCEFYWGLFLAHPPKGRIWCKTDLRELEGYDKESLF